MKLKFAAASIISIPIRMKMAWRRLNAASKPMENNAVATIKKPWSVGVMTRRSGLGSARVSRAGERILATADFRCDFSTPSVHETSGRDCFGATPLQRMRSKRQAFQPTRGTRALPMSVSSLFLHHEHEGADEGGGQEEPNALQRPDVGGHQCLADLLDCERANVRRDDRKRLCFQNRPDETAKHSKSNENTAPVKTMMFPRIAARQQNRENDQHRHCADINKHQSKSHEFPAQQEKEGCEPQQGQDQTKRRVHQVWQRRCRKCCGQREHRNNNERDAVHSEQNFRRSNCRAGASPASCDDLASGALALQPQKKSVFLFIQRNDKHAARISFVCRVGPTARCKQPRSPATTIASRVSRAPHNARPPRR